MDLDSVVEDITDISDNVLEAIRRDHVSIQDTGLSECCMCVGEGGGRE